jgi:hypothetical protein
MNQFRGRVPNYVDAGELPEFEFETEEELLSHYWLKHWTEMSDFKEFRYSPTGRKRDYAYYLMAIIKTPLFKKNEHWVMGFIKSLDGLSFKEWKE